MTMGTRVVSHRVTEVKYTQFVQLKSSTAPTFLLRFVLFLFKKSNVQVQVSI